MNLSGRDTVAIFGQGPVGLSATQLAVAMGARVIAVDPSSERLARAREFGAEAIVDPGANDPVAAIRELTHGRGAELTLAAAAVVLAATAGSLGVKGAAAWVPVITTVSAALAAHVAAARYEFLLVEYARTAAQLERLRDGRQSLADPGQAAHADDGFVAQCERVISAQNEAWMAKLSSDPG